MQLIDLPQFAGIQSQILGKIRNSLRDLPDLPFRRFLFIAIVSVKEKNWTTQWKILTKIRIAICCSLSLVSLAAY